MDPYAFMYSVTIKNTAEPSNAQASDALPQGLALYQMRDRQHGNVVACVMGHPPTWQASSDVMWNYQDMSLPVKAYAQLYNPQGVEGVEFLPNEMFFWMPEARGWYQQGQNVMGQAFMPPMSCVDGLTKWIVPKFRNGLPGLRVTRGGNVSFLSRLGALAQSTQGEEGCITLEYVLKGKPVEEEIYGVKSLLQVPFYGPQGMMVQTNWGFPILFGFRAEKGQLDANRPLFWQIVATLRRNPAWEQLLKQIMQQLQAQFEYYTQLGYSRIQAAGQLSQAISANNDAMLAGFAHQRRAARMTNAARRQVETNAPGRTTNDDFSDMMRGVETVYDPYWGESQQDANYLYHWTDGQGSYQHSDDPFFNPSIGANQDWTLMQPVQR